MAKLRGLYGMALEIGKKTCDVIEEPSVLNITCYKIHEKNNAVVYLPSRNELICESF